MPSRLLEARGRAVKRGVRREIAPGKVSRARPGRSPRCRIETQAGERHGIRADNVISITGRPISSRDGPVQRRIPARPSTRGIRCRRVGGRGQEQVITKLGGGVRWPWRSTGTPSIRTQFASDLDEGHSQTARARPTW